MAASRLTDGQKQELVNRYRQGETAQALAQAYGCSPNTVSRALKAALDPGELEAIKKQSRGRGSGTEPLPAAVEAPDPAPAAASAPPAPAADATVLEGRGDDEPSVLAIDDADDFADDGLEEGEDEGDDLDAGLEPLTVVPVLEERRVAVSVRPLHSGALPASVYLLVDKTVELEARPLREFPELAGLPAEEQERQALMLYANPRQAKRQCGRSQRVIKVPDSGVLERTASYLVAQGITRLVLEGGDLFAIPGG